VLGNWAHRRGEPWEDHLRGWLDETGCDAWVVQREVADLPEYVELWLKDAGLHGAPDYVERYDAWLAWFEEQGIEAIGFGWVNLRRRGGVAGQEEERAPLRRVEHWPYEVEQPLGGEVAAWARRTGFEAASVDAALLDSRLRVRADVRQETLGAPGAEDPETILLRQQRGMRRARQVDTVEAGMVGACDGDLTVAQILDALASLLEEDAEALRRDRLPAVRELVIDGFLVPSSSPPGSR
jgi:hypothetical protein